MDLQDIRSLTLDELTIWLTQQKQPTYRATQIFSWLYAKGAASFDDMTNLSKSLRAELARSFSFEPLSLKKKQVSVDGTIKYLFTLADQNTIETVLIPVPERNTVCISTQVGCKSGCLFCASGSRGFVRNLTAAEIISQIMHIKFHDSIAVNNLVFMGIGEPLDNLDNLLRALDNINSPNGLAIGARKITISTCGLVPAMDQLANTGRQFELSISLHAPTDELRDKIMPVNRKYPIAELVKAAQRYQEKTKRQVMFEYLLIKDFNDSEECARKLAALARNIAGKVNLIPFNAMAGFDFQPPEQQDVLRFQQCLFKRGIKATIRASRGQDITAACGQLRIKDINRP